MSDFESTATADVDIRPFLTGSAFGLEQMTGLRQAVHTASQGITLIEEALESLGGTDVATRVRRGFLNILLGRHHKAIDELEHATEDEIGLYLLGRAQLDIGDAEGATEALAEGLAAFPKSMLLRRTLTEAELRRGELEAAEKLMKDLDGGPDAAADLEFLKGLHQETSGDYDAARAHYEKAIELDASHAQALFRLGYHHSLYGDEEEAIELYERCRDLTPTFANALLNLGNLYEDQGDYEKACDAYRGVLNVIPNHDRARLFLKDAEASKTMYYDEDLERKADRRTQILKTPVTDFELSVRSRNCLNKMNIKCLGDLVQKTEAELLSYKNFGETSLQEIKQMLAQKGLRLGMGRPDQPGFFDQIADPNEPAEVSEEVLGKPLDDLKLSVRSRKVMEKLGITTVGELTQKSEQELLTAKNFGQTSLTEVRQKLAELGLSLSQSG